MTSIEEIYKSYPRHKDKRFALLSIERALRRIKGGELGTPMLESEAFEFLLQKTKVFSRSLAGNRGVYTAFPATWYNRGGYMDDPHEWDLMNREEYEDAMQANRNNVGVYRP